MKPGSLYIDGKEVTVEDQINTKLSLIKIYSKKSLRAKRTAATMLSTAEWYDKEINRMKEQIEEQRKKYQS